MGIGKGVELIPNSQSRGKEEGRGPVVFNPLVLSSQGVAIRLLFVIVISALLLLPCVWLRQIESFDLCSHIYNAWLARLITEQHVPGLYMVPQSTNIVFDSLLTQLLRLCGPVLAQRIAVSMAVLLFFWSSFTLITALSGRPPWFLVPFVAVLSYGRVFHYGFFNFYISLAFAFLALASFWRRQPWSLPLFVLTIVLSWTAHPFPAIWALATSAYIYAARDSTHKVRIALLCGSALGILLLGLYERFGFPRSAGHHDLGRTLMGIPGLDQVLAFDHPFSILSYRFVELGMLLVLALLFMQVLAKNQKLAFEIPVHLYVLTCFAAVALPSSNFYLPWVFRTPLGFISERFSLAAAMLACVVAAAAKPTRWQWGLTLAPAIIFFLVVYRDERTLVQLEEKVDQLVTPLPPRQRVAAMLHFPGAVDGFTENLVDRACVGRCYSYGNYEASSSQFRIRAVRDNPFVLARAEDSNRLAQGSYLVQSRDLPLYQIYPCGLRITDLCIRALNAGERNGGAAVQPN